MAAASVRTASAHHSVYSNLIMAAPGAQRSSAAEEIMGMSGQKVLGESSKTFGVEDFELVKTLGTGRLCVPLFCDSIWWSRMNE